MTVKSYLKKRKSHVGKTEMNGDVVMVKIERGGIRNSSWDEMNVMITVAIAEMKILLMVNNFDMSKSVETNLI